jgi:predicted nucleic acid-binding protein
MIKQNASLDASFWINACASGTIEFVPNYFQLFAVPLIAEEIRYPLTTLNIQSASALLFNAWVSAARITLQDPQTSLHWFHQGENAAIALAIEQDYFLLMDDANPYHRAKSMGLKIVGTAEFIVLLFDHNLITYPRAVEAVQQTNISKGQKRAALIAVEMLMRRKGT